jgi:hypothetical protein
MTYILTKGLLLQIIVLSQQLFSPLTTPQHHSHLIFSILVSHCPMHCQVLLGKSSLPALRIASLLSQTVSYFIVDLLL